MVRVWVTIRRGSCLPELGGGAPYAAAGAAPYGAGEGGAYELGGGAPYGAAYQADERFGPVLVAGVDDADVEVGLVVDRIGKKDDH
ncbi:hypothetical protein PVK06_037137 [Gossypium arboreum]|uniref:Uncharacterized protein n=1 Tax=Gossypium arboreum TaxID=29729 RepID=A0ABR0MWF9_GOSAR|nr:hypothetical protein PVK06_037137 [Gossypium arboreum]